MIPINLEKLLASHFKESSPSPTPFPNRIPISDSPLFLSEERLARILKKAAEMRRYSGGPPEQDVPESIPASLRQHLRSVGPLVFPSGEIAHGAWEFGLLNELSPQEAEPLIEVIAERGFEKLRALPPSNDLVLVCFGHPIHRCGKRLAAKLIERRQMKVHVVLAEHFFNPRLWCAPRELGGNNVVVFIDVVHSGGLIDRLTDVCREGRPRRLWRMAVIDQAHGTKRKEPVRSLWCEEPESRVSLQDKGATLLRLPELLRFYDPETARARSERDLPPEIADREAVRKTIERDIAPLLPLIHRTNALQSDKRIGGLHYPWVVDLPTLLNDPEANDVLLRRAICRLKDLRAKRNWCLLYPAERHSRAGRWARLLGHALNWPVVPIGVANRKHFCPLTPAQTSCLHQYRGAVIVDAAIRTGDTLRSFVEMFRKESVFPIKRLYAFYAFDGLFDDRRNALQKELKVEIRSTFRLPLGPPIQPISQLCHLQLRNTLTRLKNHPQGARADWSAEIVDYCERKLSRHRWHPIPTQHTESQFRLAMDEWERGQQARLERSCDHAKSSVLKHLDVQFALREPKTRMVLHGFLCNSMPPDFIEWCALALASQNDFDWLDKDWLLLHRDILANSKSQKWQFLACILYWIKCQPGTETIHRVRRVLEEFKTSRETHIVPLFSDSKFVEKNEDSILDSRCRSLISILS